MFPSSIDTIERESELLSTCCPRRKLHVNASFVTLVEITPSREPLFNLEKTARGLIAATVAADGGIGLVDSASASASAAVRFAEAAAVHALS